MSRIGKNPVSFDKTVSITVLEGNKVVVKGAKKSLEVELHPMIEVSVAEGSVSFKRKSEDPSLKAWHGLSRVLVSNAVVGVTSGWKKTLILNGVGYKASVSGRSLDLILGFSHPVKRQIPEGLEVKVEKQTRVIIQGVDKEKVGQFADKIRGLRPPEPYLGKGIRYEDEKIRRKAGKAAGGGDK